jgi:mannose-6-phosphate isomerase-like protein (cupin superfamily)
LKKINISQKLNLFDEYWSPKIVAELNDDYIKIVKIKGQFDWHHHKEEDELFFVFKGRLLIRFRDEDVWLDEGEFIVIPKGVDHLPIAEEEAHILLIEPKNTLNTGNIQSEKTKKTLKRL